MRLLKGKNGKLSPWKFAILIAVIAGIMVPFCTGSRGLFTLIRLHSDVSGMRKEIVETAEGNAAIKDTIEALESEDPLALEREARDLGMIKPGETVYRVVPEEE